MGYDRQYSGNVLYTRQLLPENFTRHELYTTWRMMNIRCLDDRHKAYHRYGGRGITICENWRWDNPIGLFNFINDVGIRPSGFSLDRINNDLGYVVGNVRWVDKRTQQNNIGVAYDNKTGHLGVVANPRGTGYICQINLNGESHTIGTFEIDRYDDACKAYNHIKSIKMEKGDDTAILEIYKFSKYGPTNKRLRIHKTSKFFGVSWDFERCKWRAMCSYRVTKTSPLINKMIGRFETEEEARESVLKFLDWIKENGYYKKSLT